MSDNSLKRIVVVGLISPTPGEVQLSSDVSIVPVPPSSVTDESPLEPVDPPELVLPLLDCTLTPVLLLLVVLTFFSHAKKKTNDKEIK